MQGRGGGGVVVNLKTVSSIIKVRSVCDIFIEEAGMDQSWYKAPANQSWYLTEHQMLHTNFSSYKIIFQNVQEIYVISKLFTLFVNI